MRDVAPEGETLRAALIDFSLTVSELERAVDHLGKQVGSDLVPRLNSDQIEAAWGTIRLRFERVESKFAELAESTENAIDLVDALAARAEGGESVSLEDLKAELGIE